MREKMIITGLVLIFAAMASSLVLGDDDEHRGAWGGKPEVRPVDNALYREECGSCHFAYQPGLLPAASWDKVMAGLDDHFGDNAELDPEVHKQIADYLQRYSGDRDGGNFRRARRLTRSAIKAGAPLRITEIPYFRHEHDEIPMRIRKKANDRGSLSACGACHSRADKGSFREREINIPGIGRWDD